MAPTTIKILDFDVFLVFISVRQKKLTYNDNVLYM
jgi:hypothetical protein